MGHKTIRDSTSFYTTHTRTITNNLPTMISANTFRNQILLVIGLVFVALVQVAHSAQAELHVYQCQSCNKLLELTPAMLRRKGESGIRCFAHKTHEDGTKCGNCTPCGFVGSKAEHNRGNPCRRWNCSILKPYVPRRRLSEHSMSRLEGCTVVDAN